MNGAVSAILPGGRLHLQHGPIDLVIRAYGRDVEAAYHQAWTRFETILVELVEELPALRRPGPVVVSGSVAMRMAAAIAPHSEFVTPMAAVAGSVADEVLDAMVAGCSLTKAYVNNGGDTALYLSPGSEIHAGIEDDGPAGSITLRSSDPVRGIATSGWRGRSMSLGIADAVTVLAKDAASADVATTLIANAVDLPGHPRIVREPAYARDPESDLGDRLATVHVPELSDGEIAEALARGRVKALAMREAGLIAGANLRLHGWADTLAYNEKEMSLA